MQSAEFRVVGTPDAARRYIPDFDGSIQDGPYLLILFPDGHVYVFNREAGISLAWYMIQSVNEVVRGIDPVSPSEVRE